MIPGENNAPPVRPDVEPMVDSPVTPPSTQHPTNLPRPKFPQVGSIPKTPFDVTSVTRNLTPMGATFIFRMYRYSVAIDGTLFQLSSYYDIYVWNGLIAAIVDSSDPVDPPTNYPSSATIYEYLPLGG